MGTIKIDIKDKINLSIPETEALFGIGEKKIREIISSTPNCNFVLYNGNKKLIRKKEFDEYLHENIFL